MWCKKEGQQVDGKYGAAEIKGIQKLTAAYGMLHVHALNKMLDLERGFLLDELFREMDGHILDQYTLKGIYEN